MAASRPSRSSLTAAVALALAAWAPPARGQNIDLVGPDAWSLSAETRLIAADGEPSWADGGFGKLRFGDEFGPRLGGIDAVWQPRLGWTVSATVAATLQQQADELRAGISEAFVSFNPSGREGLRISGRAGLMWVPSSLEHSGVDWHVADTITPSAINSWIGEEVRPLAVEAKAVVPLDGHRLEATAAVLAANDTAGALLVFRGWALHDLKVLGAKRWPLPELSEEFEYYQPRYTHPLLDVLPGFSKRPGYYAKLAWSPPAPLRVELFRYDNRGDPEAVNDDLEWAWRTRFNQVGVVARPSERVTLKAQAMGGTTEMGLFERGHYWIDARFRSAFALGSYNRDQWGIAARAEAFGVRQRGSLVGPEDGDKGWAVTLAGHKELDHGLALWAEAIHVESRRDAREREGLAPTQVQNQFQLALRAHW